MRPDYSVANKTWEDRNRERTREQYDDRRDGRNNYDDRRDGRNNNYDDRRDGRNNYDDRRDGRNNYDRGGRGRGRGRVFSERATGSRNDERPRQNNHTSAAVPYVRNDRQRIEDENTNVDNANNNNNNYFANAPTTMVVDESDAYDPSAPFMPLSPAQPAMSSATADAIKMLMAASQARRPEELLQQQPPQSPTKMMTVAELLVSKSASPRVVQTVIEDDDNGSMHLPTKLSATIPLQMIDNSDRQKSQQHSHQQHEQTFYQPQQHQQQQRPQRRQRQSQTIEDISRMQNAGKREILQKISGVVLDIGGGRGGDLQKWSKYVRRLYFVDPDMDNLMEAQRRFERRFDGENEGKTQILVQDVVFVHARGEDTDTILAAMQSHGDEKVDAVTMMNSLTFFFLSHERMTGLANTIRAAIRNNGIIHILTMTDHSLHDWFDGSNHRTVDGITMSIADDSSAICGQTISIHMDETIVQNQVEGVVELSALLVHFPGYEIQNVRYCSDVFRSVQENLAARGVSPNSKILLPASMEAYNWCEMYAFFTLTPSDVVAATTMTQQKQQHKSVSAVDAVDSAPDVLGQRAKGLSRKEWMDLVQKQIADILRASGAVRKSDLDTVAGQKSIWREVLTHKSFSLNTNYETMEKLGDSNLRHAFNEIMADIAPARLKSNDYLASMEKQHLSKLPGSWLNRFPVVLGIAPLIRALPAHQKEQSIIEDVGEAFIHGLSRAVAEHDGAKGMPEGHSFIIVRKFVKWMMTVHPDLRIDPTVLDGNYAQRVKEVWEKQIANVSHGGKGKLRYQTASVDKRQHEHEQRIRVSVTQPAETGPERISHLDYVLGVGEAERFADAKAIADRNAYEVLKKYENGIGLLRRLHPLVQDRLAKSLKRACGLSLENVRYDRIELSSQMKMDLYLYVEVERHLAKQYRSCLNIDEDDDDDDDEDGDNKKLALRPKIKLCLGRHISENGSQQKNAIANVVDELCNRIENL
jgi:dsRNA-specific ribonuclease